MTNSEENFILSLGVAIDMLEKHETETATLKTAILIPLLRSGHKPDEALCAAIYIAEILNRSGAFQISFYRNNTTANKLAALLGAFKTAEEAIKEGGFNDEVRHKAAQILESNEYKKLIAEFAN